jgi:hypothetical protein
MVLLFGNVAAIFIIPFTMPWYITIPLETYLFNLVFGRNPCLITNLENTIRQKLGYRQIGGFVGHYFMKPYKIWRYGKREPAKA